MYILRWFGKIKSWSKNTFLSWKKKIKTEFEARILATINLIIFFVKFGVIN